MRILRSALLITAGVAVAYFFAPSNSITVSFVSVFLVFGGLMCLGEDK